MDPFLTELLQGIDTPSPSGVSPWLFLFTVGCSAGLNFLFAKTYSLTHSGYSYSRSFLQSIVLVGIIVSLIMVIIGSDIARAFALVGAMSIVRFRTPIKDSRDLIFIFAAIAIGMACGVQFFVIAAIFTAVMIVFVLVFHYLRFGELSDNGYVLRVQVRGDQRESLQDAVASLCRRAAIVSISRLSESNDVQDIIYEVELKRGIPYDQFIDRLSKLVQPISINMLVGESSINA